MSNRRTRRNFLHGLAVDIVRPEAVADMDADLTPATHTGRAAVVVETRQQRRQAERQALKTARSSLPPSTRQGDAP